MGETSVIFGVRVIRNGDGILLSQKQYTEKLFKKFGYYNFKSVNTTYDTNLNIREFVSQSQYNGNIIVFNELL